MNYRVMFEDVNYVRHDVAICNSERGAFRAAMDDLKARYPDFVCHYIRNWKDADGNTVLDFGSHSEFYIISSMFDFS